MVPQRSNRKDMKHNYRIKTTKKKFTDTSESPCTDSNLTVDCSGLGLDYINSTWFPYDTEGILFNDNGLNTLLNSTFSHLIHLKHLDVSDNYISTIDLLAFEGLINLKYLYLSSNKISFDKISVDIFNPLKSLEYLAIWYLQDQYCDAPSAMFRPLTQLRGLSISTVSHTLYFGPEFLNLTQLSVLKLTGSTRDITNTSFENIKHLSDIVLVDMKSINYIDVNALIHFKNLTSIVLWRVFYEVKNVLPMLWPFRGRNMTEIFARLVTTQKSIPNPWKSGFLSNKDLHFLTDICVEYVTMSYCNIYYITADALGNTTIWNRCLRYVVVSENPLVGSYMALYSLSILQNIETVVVNKALLSCETVSDFSRLEIKDKYFFENMSQKDSEKRFTIEDPVLKFIRLSRDTHMLPSKTVYVLNGTVYIHVSESLASWDSQQLLAEASFEQDITFKGANNFKYIDMSDCGIHTFTGNIKGLSSLQTVILSGNNLNYLSESFLDGFLGLENVYASKCNIDKDFFAMKSDRIFQKTRSLKTLDLSKNYLNTLSPGTFLTNSEIIYLRLSDNLFNDIPFKLALTPNLVELDLSNNAITTLTSEITNLLDWLYSKNGQMKLKLNGNILSCGCRDLTFLHWLNQTLIQLDNNRNYTCMNKDGERTNTLTFSDLESLWRQCWGELFFYIALITLCLYVIGVVLLFLILKNKNFLVSYFLQLLGNFKLHIRSDYKTDVYIGYSDEDYRFPCLELREHLEQVLKLSTFIIDRDLLASIDKASGIVNAMNSCWRVLLVCSERFLKSEDWSMFTMRTAVLSQSPANPARIVIIVHKSCLSLISTELLSAVNDENILVVSEWKINYILSEKLRTRLID
ncbi:toll-like receptor 8 isoform X3 [Biomphalaria glabrata]|uniref:Toll-like receptor 8 isoform X3 n=1 Tax=Biomphalaria glabrata TaxID=6526 RepID=A0A9W2YRX4_BIOGL|nr:toll-like receptor 8 isoform X3 [Biomphalaria glabrata]